MLKLRLMEVMSTGVKAASLRYFQKLPDELNLDECALLAGLPQSPNKFRPDRYPDNAKTRRDKVFLRMVNDEYITITEYKQFKDTPITAGCYSLYNNKTIIQQKKM